MTSGYVGVLGESLLEQVEKKIYGFEFKAPSFAHVWLCSAGQEGLRPGAPGRVRWRFNWLWQVKEQSYALAVAQEKCQACRVWRVV